MAGRSTPATALLVRERVTHHVHTYEHDPRSTSYGQEAAEALECSPERVFKTLVAEVDGTLTIAVLPVTGSLDLKALAAARSGKKAGLVPEPDAERVTGYVSGGISPLGQKRRSLTVLDASAMRYDTVYCSAGRRGLEIELSPGELVRLTGATVATITARRG